MLFGIIDVACCRQTDFAPSGTAKALVEIVRYCGGSKKHITVRNRVANIDIDINQVKFCICFCGEAKTPFFVSESERGTDKLRIKTKIDGIGSAKYEIFQIVVAGKVAKAYFIV